MDYFFNNICYKIINLKFNLLDALIDDDLIYNINCLTNINKNNILYLGKGSDKIKNFSNNSNFDDFSANLVNNLTALLADSILEIDKKYNIIISSYHLNYAKNLTKSIDCIVNLLHHNGIFMTYFVGDLNFIEMRKSFLAITCDKYFNRFLPSLNIKSAGKLFNFVKLEDIVTSSIGEVVEFENFHDICNFIKRTSLGNPFLNLNEAKITKNQFKEIENYYEKNFTKNGKFQLTVDFISAFGIKR